MSKPSEHAGSGLRRRIRRPFDWLDTGLDLFEKTVLAVGILAMATVSVANVLSRNLLGSSLQYANDVAQILLVIVTFMGIGVAAREARHIRVSAIHDLLPATARKILLTFIGFTSSALLLLLAHYGWSYARSTQRSCRVLPEYIEIGFLSVPVGALPLGIGFTLVLFSMILAGHAIRLTQAGRQRLLKRFAPWIQTVLLVAGIAVGLAIAAWLFGLFTELVDNRSGRCRVTSSTGFPVYLVYMLVPLGFVLGAIQFFLAGVRNLTSRDNYLSWYRPDEYESAEQAAGQTGVSRSLDSEEDRNG